MESDYIPSHGHPAYEETFNRIATILDVIAGSQAEHADEMAEIRKLQAQQERTLARHAEALARHEAAMEEMRVRHDASWERFNQGMDRLDRALEKLTLKSAETEEKLNALISMFDQHLNDHHNNDRRNR
jgi:chromosome segregation ATPase